MILELDFLRHIVNPVVNKYVEEKILSPKEALEIKKAIYQAESKYKFNASSGDVRNLSHFLRSEDFKGLIKLLKSCNAINVVVEILEKAKTYYAKFPELVKDIDEVLVVVSGGEVEEQPIEKESKIDLNVFARLLREEMGFTDIVLSSNKLIARENDVIEFKLNVLKQNIKIELKFNKSIKKQRLKIILSKVMKIAEEAIGV